MNKGGGQERESLSDAQTQIKPWELAVHLVCVSLGVSSFLPLE